MNFVRVRSVYYVYMNDQGKLRSFFFIFKPRFRESESVPFVMFSAACGVSLKYCWGRKVESNIWSRFRPAGTIIAPYILRSSIANWFLSTLQPRRLEDLGKPFLESVRVEKYKIKSKALYPGTRELSKAAPDLTRNAERNRANHFL